MKVFSVIAGFLPFAVFSALAASTGVGWAALAGLAAAILVVVSTARGGLKVLPVLQGAILAAMAVLGFVGSPELRDQLTTYGPATAAVFMGTFMVATAYRAPFTAQLARASVPREVWHTKRFLLVNRKISSAWGCAVLLLGACHFAGATIDAHGVQLLWRLAVNWGIPIVAFWQASAFTQRTVAAAGRRLTQTRDGSAG